MPADPADGTPAPLLEVGRITKPHGLRGEVVVILSTDRDERVDPGTILDSDRGQLVVRTSRPHQDRWIVGFEGHTSREAADSLRNLVLRAEPLDEPDELWVHQLVGNEVVTTSGTTVGTCVAVVANPASDLIELDSGALVPVVFVVDGEDGQVTIDPPEGLFDL